MTTNLVYRNLGTPIKFMESTGDVVITLKNLAANGARLSARYDRGAGDKPVRYLWQGIFQFETAPIVGELVEIYLFESDGTYADGAVGTADDALTAAQMLNGKLIGVVQAQTTGTATNFIASGICYIWQRYVSVGVYNRSAGDNLENTDNASLVILTPMTDSVQAAA